MNSIPQEQNTERQRQRLAAQRQLYSTAKSVFAWQVFVSGPTAVLLAFAAILWPSIKVYSALLGIILVFADVLWVTPWIKRLRTMAAKIQELFDCDALVLPWADIKVGKRPDPELIKEQAEKYNLWANKMPTLSNWYDIEVGKLPLYIARIACQRSNCWWDAQQRRRYAFWILVSISVLFLSVLGLALKDGLTIENFLLKVIAPLAPALIIGIRQYKEQMEAAELSNSLKDHAEKLWTDALSGKKESEISTRSRELQNEIYDSRRRSPLVFDIIFRKLRSDYETQMNYGIAELVLQAKQKLKLTF